MRLALLLLAFTTTATAQWTLQTSHATASLRGIHALSPQLAWASGTQGTVLHTEDGGTNWKTCTTPPDAEKLDFRGIQALDKNTAFVMSSGKGKLSRVYETTNACKTWTLELTNFDPEGFWDAIQIVDHHILILSDPVDGHFRLYESNIDGLQWHHRDTDIPSTDEGAFAASNTSLLVSDDDGNAFFGAGGTNGARLFIQCDSCASHGSLWTAFDMPMFPTGAGAGIFSLASTGRKSKTKIIAVGGDYTHPDDATKTAAYSLDNGKHWFEPRSTPHGYRSAVAYSAATKTWITVGPNGTDVSTDDGNHWLPLTPSPTDTLDADKDWNALSLPFVVGPKGRIGILKANTLQPK